MIAFCSLCTLSKFLHRISVPVQKHLAALPLQNHFLALPVLNLLAALSVQNDLAALSSQGVYRATEIFQHNIRELENFRKNRQKDADEFLKQYFTPASGVLVNSHTVSADNPLETLIEAPIQKSVKCKCGDFGVARELKVRTVLLDISDKEATVNKYGTNYQLTQHKRRHACGSDSEYVEATEKHERYVLVNKYLFVTISSFRSKS